jgi:tetratricopeptide (TPR) repeat protein
LGKAGSVTSVRSKEPLSQLRLDGWKAIARHFGRSCRTVQRWHAEFGLPIRRLGGDKGPIYAYDDELDAWMRARGLEATDENRNSPGLEVLNARQLRDDAVQRNDILNRPLISDSAKAQSAGLVALAYKMWETISYSNLGTIARLFREAMDCDPGNAAAFAGLSFALITQGFWGLVRAPDAYTSAKAALQRALEIDLELPEAKCAAAWIKMVSERDWQGARHGFDEAFKHQPPTVRAMVGRALLYIAEGSLQEASNLLQETARQYPLSSDMTTWYCWNEYLMGDYANVLDQVEQFRASGRHGPITAAIEALACIQLEAPDAQIEHIEALAMDYRQHDIVRGALGYAYGMAGQSQKAREILDAMTHPSKRNDSREPYAAALVLIGLNEKQEAVKRLEQSYVEGSHWSLGFPYDPILASLRNDPHYQLFLSKVSYPEPEISVSRSR